MAKKNEIRRVLLGLGEQAKIRRPTRKECSRHGLAADELVIEYRHPDRDPDILPAHGTVLTARRYGVHLPGRTT